MGVKKKQFWGTNVRNEGRRCRNVEILECGINISQHNSRNVRKVIGLRDEVSLCTH